MKPSVFVARLFKVAVIAVVFVAITWQAHVQQKSPISEGTSTLTQQAGMVPQDWAKHRQAQVKELTRVMPNRFALSKAYIDSEEAL